METARRLGAFLLVLALLLFALYRQSEPVDLEWRGQLLAYSILSGWLGLLLVLRYRSRAGQSSRFSGIRDMLFRNPSRKKSKKKQQRPRRGKAAEEASEEE